MSLEERISGIERILAKHTETHFKIAEVIDEIKKAHHLHSLTLKAMAPLFSQLPLDNLQSLQKAIDALEKSELESSEAWSKQVEPLRQWLSEIRESRP